MLDIVMLALGLGFFVLSIGYAHLCDLLWRRRPWPSNMCWPAS